MIQTYRTKVNSKCCCSCRHNIRLPDEQHIIQNYCNIDNHNIDYVSCFERSCKHWAVDHKWNKDKDAEIYGGNHNDE